MSDYKYDDENDKYDDVDNFYIMDNGLIVFDEKSLTFNLACMIRAAHMTSIIAQEPMTEATAVASAIVMIKSLKERFNKRNGKKSQDN